MPGVRIAKAWTLYYRECGAGDRILLLIHGNTASSLWWERVMAYLPPGIRAVAPDLRLCGDSDKPDGPVSMADLADDLYQFTRALGLARFTVVGHSAGGAVAQQLTTDHPELVERLVLINSGPAEGMSFLEPALPQLELFARQPEILKAGLAACMPSAPKDEFIDRLIEESVAKSSGAYVPFSRALIAMNLTEAVKAINAPVLIIYGLMNDPIVKLEMMERTRDLIPGAVLETWDGVGHAAPVEAPERLARRIAEFMGA